MLNMRQIYTSRSGSTCRSTTPVDHPPRRSSAVHAQCASVRLSLICEHALISQRRALTSRCKAAGNGVAVLHAWTLPQLDTLPLPVGGPFGVWMVLLFAGAFGTWAERNSKLGKQLSGALVATLMGMLLANMGVISHETSEAKIVYKMLLPLAIPLLLLTADMRRVLTETGRLLPAFLLGAICTVIGSVFAMVVFPLGQYLGEDGWKVAAALTARHIGGAINYMSVCQTLNVAPSTFSCGLAADDLILTLYFTTLYALAQSIPPDPSPVVLAESSKSQTAAESPKNQTAAESPNSQTAKASAASIESKDQVELTPHAETLPAGETFQVQSALLVLTISATVCHIGSCAASFLSAPDQSITIITALTVILATMLPRFLAPLAVTAEGLAQVLMQVFFATIGTCANVPLVLANAPALFGFSAIALFTHLALILGFGKLFRFSLRDILLASNANIGGPSTVAGMAAAKGWRSALVPVILTSTLGYSLGTFVGLTVGKNLLCHLSL